MEKVEVLDNGCWRWTGTLFNSGYGRLHRASGSQLAHRIGYELLVGPIPKSKTLDHICHNEDPICNLDNKCPHRACVNPAHVEPATHKQNILRGRGSAAKNTKLTHCKRGHLLRGKNLLRMNGKRACRTCRKEQDLATKRSPAGKERDRAYAKTEKRRAYAKAYRESHRDETREYQREWKRRKRAAD